MKPPDPDVTISTRLLLRLIVFLIGLWSLFCGVILLALHGASAGALGAGVADEAGQRLVGAHMLVLVPLYLLIAWHPERYGGFLWLPFAAQLVVVTVVGYNILAGDTDVGDGILAVAVGSLFVGPLGFLWISEQRTVARLKMDAEERASAPALPPGEEP